MDDSQFDRLIRSLTMPSRRALFSAITSALFGGALGTNADEAEAKRTRGEHGKRDKHGKSTARNAHHGGTDAVQASGKKKKKKKKSPTLTNPTVVPPSDPCASCSGDQVCRDGACIVPACGAGGPCRVFLSSTLYTGNLGGLSGADAKCQGLADAARLPGTYKAWLSDATSSPNSRFVPSSGPYRLVNGTTIAANWTDLTDWTLVAPINVTETGGGIGATEHTWTSTGLDGTPASTTAHCANWSTSETGSATGGFATKSDGAWTSNFGALCGGRFHLYCFQQS